MSDLQKIALGVMITGMLSALLTGAALFRDTHVRGWRDLDWPSFFLRIGAIVLSLSVAGLGFLGTAARFGQLGSLQNSVAELKQNATPRRLPDETAAKLTQQLRMAPIKLEIRISYCMSDRTALDLGNDFATAFQTSGVSLGPGVGANSQCSPGDTMYYPERDDRTEDFVRKLLVDSGLTSAVAAQPAPLPSNTASLYLGLKTPSSL